MLCMYNTHVFGLYQDEMMLTIMEDPMSPDSNTVSLTLGW